MTSHLLALCIDANDPLPLARFWGDFLGWEMADPQDGIALLPSDDTGFRMRFLPTREQKTVQNLMHFDLTSTSLEGQQQTVTRLWDLVADASTSARARTRIMSCSPTRRVTSSTSSAGQQVPR